MHGDGRIARLEAGDAATETGGARPEPLQATSAPPGPTAQRDQRHREREIRLCERLNVRFAPKADKRVDVSLSPLCADFVAEVAEEERPVGAELEA